MTIGAKALTLADMALSRLERLVRSERTRLADDVGALLMQHRLDAARMQRMERERLALEARDADRLRRIAELEAERRELCAMLTGRRYES